MPRFAATYHRADDLPGRRAMTITVAGYLITWDDMARLDDGLASSSRPARSSPAAGLVSRMMRGPARSLACAVVQDEFGARFHRGLDEDDRVARQVVYAIRHGLNGVSFKFRRSRRAETAIS